MTKKEDFKSFIANKPELVKYINNGQMTWQKFYEIYDLYGPNDQVWNEYREVKSNSSSASGINKINDLIKNVDMQSIKEHINTAQKALDFVQELTSKGSPSTPKTPATPRPLNKFFED